jgi:hypothetical protein
VLDGRLFDAADQRYGQRQGQRQGQGSKSFHSRAGQGSVATCTRFLAAEQ